jgi:hypothetical protein
MINKEYKNWKGICTKTNYLDFEILNEQIEYLEKLKDPNTIEAKLAAKYSKISLNKFLKHTGKQQNNE